MASASDLYIGLMSGTSMDGIDAALVSFAGSQPELLATHTTHYGTTLRQRIIAASQNKANPDELGELDHQIGQLFAQAACAALELSGLTASQVTAIGSHGQTVRHQPRSAHPFSMQLGDPNIIVERTGIPTVADFRRRDLAAHGEGAPLAPAFHQAFFAHPDEDRCILNIGGIANISWLPGNSGQTTLGFDTGPGNALLDAWCQDQTGKPFDQNGRWASEGRIHQDLLNDLLSDAYFSLPPPKSTGKEKFNLQWLKTFLNRHPDATGADIQRTLLELTVTTITHQLPESGSLKIFACGGGVYNDELMNQLRRACAPCPVSITDELGIHAQWVEAIAFAWLAQQTMEKRPGNLPDVTGASGGRILGGVYWP
ncbi:anhydro-N-acetylmuramic acid kinase [Marinobacter sp. X15-166B]|uniref:anhydro-N-acetylmuramic acid kinase n=1 Tax=Marinobacter sp. X15-166B TaxID=1897620 RepID=UPI00085CBDA7|nr:anhydro-N-acetylmuramic acid kinase [Marinobacter sp. X15-166B]OEY66529.1 anhydro-N-acetylmuramic acid kinase [Marinobacter sp. X15-166B]